MTTNLSQGFVLSIEGEVSYSDGSKGNFGAAIDANGNQETTGSSKAFADVFTRIQSLFVALAGTINCSPSPTTSGKTVTDTWCRFEVSGDIATGKFGAFAEYTAKSGAYAGGGKSVDYKTAVANFQTAMQGVLTQLAGVTVTIS